MITRYRSRSCTKQQFSCGMPSQQSCPHCKQLIAANFSMQLTKAAWKWMVWVEKMKVIMHFRSLWGTIGNYLKPYSDLQDPTVLRDKERKKKNKSKSSGSQEGWVVMYCIQASQGQSNQLILLDMSHNLCTRCTRIPTQCELRRLRV